MPYRYDPLRPVAGITFLSIVILTASATRADVLAVRGRPLAVGVTVTDLRDGQLQVRLPNGNVAAYDLADIQYVRITGWDAFNQAEKHIRDGNPRQASILYEKALAMLNAGGPAPVSEDLPLDVKLLAQARLLQAYNAIGRFDRAVIVYLQVVDKMPAWLETLRPPKLPAANSTFLATAAAQVDAAIARHRDDPIGKSLRQWRETWPAMEAEPASRPEPTSGPPADPLLQSLDEIARLVEAEQYAEALDRIEALQTPGAGRRLADLFYWQGRALAGLHESTRAGETSVMLSRAGLAYMRVVIHFPDHPLAAESLYRAGELCLRANRPAQARRLWTEVIQRYSTQHAWADRARQQRALLSPAATQPRTP